MVINKNNFKCKQCGQCCRPIVLLTEEDIKRIEELGVTDFIDIDPIGEETKTVIKQKNHVCMFLKKVGDKFICSIYNHRPEICGKYPFTETNEVENCKPNGWERWEKLLELFG